TTRVGEAGPRARSRGEPLDAKPARRRPSGRGRGAPRPVGDARVVGDARALRAHAAARPLARASGRRTALRAGDRSGDTRLRDGLLVARPPAPPAAAPDQDRPLVRPPD